MRAIASEGLAHAVNPYDIERYERLLSMASHRYGHLANLPSPAVDKMFRQDLGMVTPKLGVEGAIVASGRVLVTRRADDGRWSLPGGWVNPNESVTTAVRREVLEETGLRVRVQDLVAVLSRDAALPSTPHGSCHLLFACQIISGKLRPSHESTEFLYWDPWKPLRWHRDHRKKARAAVQFMRDRDSETTAGHRAPSKLAGS